MTLRRAPVQTIYVIGRARLEHVQQIRDLGVLLDSKLTFGPHVDAIVRQGNRALGMLIRSLQTGLKRSKLDKGAALAAYFANVRSILEYASVIWTGAAHSHTVRVDRVQHKFLMWLIYHSNAADNQSLSYPNLLKHFKIPSLESRRVQHDLLFLRNVFTAKLDSSQLLTSFSLHVPTRSTRTPRLFYEPRARVATVQSGVFCRLPRLANVFLSKGIVVDFFSDSPGRFRAIVKRYIVSL